MDSIGANEYLVDVAHGMCDFISTVDTPSVWELNIWYHTLNCGYRCRISGETDFPCIYGERVGLGRSYVHLDGKLDFDRWCEGIKKGRRYVSDGKSHLLDFAVDGKAVGIEKSEVKLKSPGKVKVSARVAALLGPGRAGNRESSRRRSRQNRTGTSSARGWGTAAVPVEVVERQGGGDEEIEAGSKDRTFPSTLRRAERVRLPACVPEPHEPIPCRGRRQFARAKSAGIAWRFDRCWKQEVAEHPREGTPGAEITYDQAEGIQEGAEETERVRRGRSRVNVRPQGRAMNTPEIVTGHNVLPSVRAAQA